MMKYLANVSLLYSNIEMPIYQRSEQHNNPFDLLSGIRIILIVKMFLNFARDICLIIAMCVE